MGHEGNSHKVFEDFCHTGECCGVVVWCVGVFEFSCEADEEGEEGLEGEDGQGEEETGPTG